MKITINQLIDHLSSGMVEREEPVRLALLALFSGEHLFLLGPPGTAKSALARRVKNVLSDAQYFERLLTRFSVPEELFGPLSIKALEQDRYHRLTERYLPTSSLAFIDEIFKANSAILNALLTLLNEREFDNGVERVTTPLLAVIGASNELPEEAELDALYDRFLLRCHLDYVSEAGFETLLLLDEVGTLTGLAEDARITRQQIQQVQQLAVKVTLTEDTVALIKQLRLFLQQQDIPVSDRRWRKAIKLLKVASYLNGKQCVDPWDCCVLQHCLWRQPEQREPIRRWFQAQQGLDSEKSLQRFQRLLSTWKNTLQQEQEAAVQIKDDEGQPLFYDLTGKRTTQCCTHRYHGRDGEALYLAPEGEQDRTNDGRGYTVNELRDGFFDDTFQQSHIQGRWVKLDEYVADQENRLSDRIEHQPCTLAKHYSQAHIDSRVGELKALCAAIDSYCSRLAEQQRRIQAELPGHLWIPEHQRSNILQGVTTHSEQAQALKRDAIEVQQGFAGLPGQYGRVEDDAAAEQSLS